MRLIDAHLFKFINEQVCDAVIAKARMMDDDTMKLIDFRDKVNRLIEAQPTVSVDVINAVHCEECKYGKRTCTVDGFYICKRLEGYPIPMLGTDYCSYGKE